MPTVKEHGYFIIYLVDCIVHSVDCIVDTVDRVVHLVNFDVDPVSDLQGFCDRHPSLFHRKCIQLLQRILKIVLAEKLLQEFF